tara:strand:- start:58 stop:276 length:219 start_codon:yes stop_codon:yes gene_type:complete
MKASYFTIFLLSIVSSFFTTGCKKCYDCEKQIYIENKEGEKVATDAYYEEEACSKKDKENYEDDGYTCTAQL